MVFHVSGMRSRKIALNLINNYGQTRFNELIRMLLANESGALIAKEFNVSRQRVNQWKRALGYTKTTFSLNPEVEKLIGLGSSLRTTV